MTISYRPYSDIEQAGCAPGCCRLFLQGQQPAWNTPENRDYLVMLSAQVERRLGRSGGFFLYHGEVIDVGGQQPEQVPPGMIYCDELDRWMPKDWVSDTSTENQL